MEILVPTRQKEINIFFQLSQLGKQTEHVKNPQFALAGLSIVVVVDPPTSQQMKMEAQIRIPLTGFQTTGSKGAFDCSQTHN